MNRGLLISVWLLGAGAFMATASAGDISGRILITKSLTKKRITLPSYQLRDVSLPFKQETPTSINEFSRLAVYLEGPVAASGAPISAKLIQQDRRFEPEVLVIPLGSTVSFPNADPIFQIGRAHV